MSDGDNWVDHAVLEFHSGRPLTLLFDYDGTLAPIVPHPALAILAPQVRARLRRLARAPGVAVGVISGRALADVRDMVGIDDLYFGGSGGAELDLCGVTEVEPIPADAQRQLTAAVSDLRAALAGFHGVWLEPKPVGFAVHYRATPEPTATAFHAFFSRWHTQFPALRVLDVCKSYEVGLRDGWDKGDAVRRVLAEQPAHTFAAYFGDSENDRPAMAAVVAADGVSVGVGPEAPAGTRYTLPTPARLHTDLARLCGALNLFDRGTHSAGGAEATRDHLV
ncbi:Trehalose-phosphate phosphatase [Gemmata obscuriglobus]|uniref:Trehalose 6-phosphate phosphatase n=1 Tax=Gemmata obscuriglobus TaxID=114 RepID=A0A2Z3HAD9_9BACT|nr:trehalose-phosphatase [Gemmata obscuriglobus]AWM38644.1 trehalose-phosphatase [Gemmata obscuriglobus]QEG28397.1 Trehalose-phosphate phosphatase [Gemmata obscuriglobus]VTS06331.1 beta-phosphoglucomutase hydrolase : Trehalose 6-phosphate phosphatase OS=Candidatus Competibacter denitrificans Run_A_D11 GN=BN873_30026 PE=3 SV=1: Trehalose_PPase [Gemmata obscuriglobus UQM 2246]